MEVFKERTDAAHPASAGNNAEILSSFNQAIKALYSLEVGAFSARASLNLTTDFEQLLDSLDLHFGDWANKLEVARALAFGESVDWDKAQTELEDIAAEYRKETET